MVAAIQLFNSKARSLTAWKGAGFGMFASIDAPSIRHWVTAGGARYSVPLDPRLERRYMVAMKMPTRGHLRSVAEGLKPIVEQKVSGPYEIAVSVAGIDYDPATHSLQAYEYDLGAARRGSCRKAFRTEGKSSRR